MIARALRLAPLLALLLLAGLRAQPASEPGFIPYNNAPVFLAAVDASIDVVYKEVHGVEIRLDVYRPKGRATAAGPLPVLVNIHGGGFREGTKFGFALNTFLGETFLPLIEAGEIAVVSIAYRFFDEQTPLPAIIGDGFDALRWLRTQGPALGLDPEQVVVLGHSAGAHLALMLGLAPSEAFPRDREGSPARVVGIAALAPPTDFRLGGRDRADLLGATRAADPARYELCSPAAHVRTNMPPVLLICGSRDSLLPHAERFLAAASAVGAPCRFVRVERAPHRLYQPQPGWDPDGPALQALLRGFVADLVVAQPPPRLP